MKMSPMFALSLATLAVAAPAAGVAREKKVPEQVGRWATCAVEKNADEVTWMYILQSDQSGLKGAAFDGAVAHAVFLMARDCAPEGTSFDNEAISAFSERAFALWGGDLSKNSLKRSIDPWADCMAQHHSRKARAYLAARDFSFGGPKLMVEGVDPVEAIFEPTAECDAMKSPGDMNRTDVYARLNYLLRVKPRLGAAPATAGGENR